MRGYPFGIDYFWVMDSLRWERGANRLPGKGTRGVLDQQRVDLAAGHTTFL
jgi:hypothetical protein